MTLTAADAHFAARLQALLPPDTLRPVQPRYLEEPRGRYHGQCGVLALPRTVQDVSVLMAQAHAARVPVVPYGGGTGLVGGQIMSDGPAPLVISLERMAQVQGVYAQENVMIAQAGAVLADLQARARDANRLFPLSLASEGTAQIGGLLSTNAGGVNVLRYGNTRDLCLGIQAVLPDGRIWNGLSRLRKDNTGYDLKQLLIGAEGTLGMITAAALKLYPIPAHQGAALLQVASPQAALDLLSMARDLWGEAISAFELIHGQGLRFLAETLPDIRQPFAQMPDWSVLIDLGLSQGQDPMQGLEQLFERAMQQGLADDGVIAQSLAQRQQLWTLREHIPEANRKVGALASHDISIPISRIPAFLVQGQELVAQLGPFRVNAFGHLGDGNLHFNVFPPAGQTKQDFPGMSAQIMQAIHDLVHRFDGSVSAEHGIGRLKTGDLARYADPVELSLMQQIKTALDPHGIMNPGAVLLLPRSAGTKKLQ